MSMIENLARLDAGRNLFDLRQCDHTPANVNLDTKMTGVLSQNAIFRTAMLDNSSARQAFPLVQIFQPNLTLEGWTHFVSGFMAYPPSQAGLMSVLDTRGYIHAIFSYRVADSISHRRVIRVADMVLAHLPGQLLLRSVLGVARQMADDRDCDAVLVELTERTRHAQGDLAQLGAIGYEALSIGYLYSPARVVPKAPAQRPGKSA